MPTKNIGQLLDELGGRPLDDHLDLVSPLFEVQRIGHHVDDAGFPAGEGEQSYLSL